MREWRSGDIRVLEAKDSSRSMLPPLFGREEALKARRFHSGTEGYERTPLVSLPGLAENLHVKGIYVKDESGRFSLNAFKGLGGSYAMFRILCDLLSLNPEKTTLQDLTGEMYRERLSQIEFVTCTDGNHGRGVSWAAGLFGCRAHVFMPYGSREVRAEAVRRAGPAEVTITEMNYDDTVRYAGDLAERRGWILIQDTAWDGYETIPAWIVQGYLTLALEATEEFEALGIRPTHVFLQAGVGAMAGGVLAHIAEHYGGSKPVVAIVEPDTVDCICRSAKAGDGKPHSVEGMPQTIMAGLNCGTPCRITWPILRDYAEYYISCSDLIAEEGMRCYASGLNGDPKIISGESGAVTLGAAVRILRDGELAEVRTAMGLDADSVIFLISTEGDTDPDSYSRIVG